MRLFPRYHHWVFVLEGETLPKGKIIWAEPWGGGALQGGVKVCVVRRRK